jgi:autotransporter-associated beta strand protein
MASIRRAAKAPRARNFGALLVAGLVSPLILAAVGGGAAQAGQLTASDFTAYDPATASTITPGPFSLYEVSVDSLRPTQENEGLTEVGKKAAGFDLDTSATLQPDLLTDIEPVVIGPGGQLYLTDGHHTFTALEDSTWGASNPTVFVNVIANYSNLTMAQFIAQMESSNFLLPLNDGVATTVDPNTGAPIPTTLTGLTSDPYRGLEYSILKNKSSVLFTTASNITGKVGSSIPGLDKMTGLYSDFFEADAYRDANGGLGLPYLSPGDIAIATDWNLNAASTTTLPNVAGTVTAAQLPGFILSNNVVNAGGISNTTLSTGAMDGNGGFTGLTLLHAGTAAEPVTIGTPNVGFILQLGADNGDSVTLNGANTYTGGTSILAGHLIVQSDASLGAAAATGGTLTATIPGVQAVNGIVFNSLTEGAGTLTLGTTTGGSFATNRVIGVDGETATLDANDNTVTLTGQIVSLGTAGVGLGNATGPSDLTFDDLSSADAGKFILSTPSPLFYGDVIIGNTGAPTVEVMSDAALGNTTGAADSIGEVELNGGTLQAGASFNAPERNLFLGGGSQIDVNGFATTWGTISDTQRTLEILNSNATTAGAITFNALDVSATAILQLAGGAKGETVTLTNGVAALDPSATLILQGSSSSSLGTTEQVLASNGASSLVNTIAPAWIVTNNGTKSGGGAYDFVTYGANGYVKATYDSTVLNGTTGTDVIALAANTTASGNVAAYALNTEGKNITLGANTLMLGDGKDPAGLILGNGTTISGGTLALGASQGVIWMGGASSTIGSTITGANGLTFAGSGGVTLTSAANVSGPIELSSGTLTLSGTNVFSSDIAGITLANTKSKPAAATLAITANNAFTTINAPGTNSTITLGNGAVLTLGDTTNNLSSTIAANITETGAATAGALTLNGSGLFDLSGIGKGKLKLVSGSSLVVDDSARLRVVANEFVAGTTIVLNGTSDLQFAQNGGGVFSNTVTGSGTLHLIGGTLQITGTSNSYTGGTIVETGSTLDITTANLPTANPNITDAGGLILFDQATTGTYAGVISDGKEMGTGPLLSGSLDKDDGTGANAGDLILSQAQAYTGMTYVEAGEMTLNAVDTVATSSGVLLGRVGGGSTATLALGADNRIQGLWSNPGDTTSVLLGANTLTIAPPSGVMASFGGSVSGAGTLAMAGSGVQVFTGMVSVGAVTVASGELAVDGGTFTAPTGTVSGGVLDVAGGAASFTTLNVAGGLAEATGGTLAATTTNIGSGGIFELNGGALSGTALNIAAGGTLVVPLRAAIAEAVNNAGTIDIRNGAGNNVVTLGAYTGSTGTLDIGANFGARTADKLVVASAAGTTQIVVTDLAPNSPAPFNPTGIPVVATTGALAASNFTLAGGPIQKGLFEEALAYDAGPQMVLIGVPNADAFRLSTLPTAAQSIWLATADVWSDHQSGLRDQVLSGQAPADSSAATPGVWARLVGDWAHRREVQSYSDLGNTYAFQTGYDLNTGGFFGGLDLTRSGLLGKDDTLVAGIGGGYVTSQQRFKGSATEADYSGGAFDLSATWLDRGFFVDAAFKADLLGLTLAAPAVAPVGASNLTTHADSYGVIADAGYRWGAGRVFVEPIATLAYVTSNLGSGSLAGDQVGFGNNDIFRGRLGLSAGTTLWSTDDYQLTGSLNGSWWAKLSGGSSATIDSGPGAPLLTLSDQQVSDYGEFGVTLNAVGLKHGWSGFVSGSYRFASGYNGAELRGGLRYAF